MPGRDRGTIRRPRRLELIAYQLKGKTYERVQADQQGRVRLEPLNLLLGVRVDPRTGGDRLVLIDPATDQEIGDYAAVDRARAQAEAQAQAATERADAEAQARAAAEARIRELEAELKARKRRK